MAKKKKFGSVKLDIQNSSTQGDTSISETDYCDGSEEELLGLFSKSKNSADAISKRLKYPHSWALLYHLSPIRENVLNWFDFRPGSTLLEIGAGPGAVTGALLAQCHHVTSLELSVKRAEILARRHSHAKNLSVVAANFMKWKNKTKFDYATMVGVLEYAPLYVKSKHPAIKLLETAADKLKDNGELIIAIENRLGLKYWSGSPEDHTGEIFDSLTSYPQGRGVKTYSKGELEKALFTAGFSDVEFYYPYPDYKMPSAVFSDSYLRSESFSWPNSYESSPSPSGERMNLFSEGLALKSLIKNGLAPEFMNSFIAVARKG